MFYLQRIVCCVLLSAMAASLYWLAYYCADWCVLLFAYFMLAGLSIFWCSFSVSGFTHPQLIWEYSSHRPSRIARSSYETLTLVTV